jgi:hypothetical protein
MKKTAAAFCVFLLCRALFAQSPHRITGVIEWDRMELNTVVSLNLREAGLSLPAGRYLAEALLEDRYPALIRGVILSLQADSSSTLQDLVDRGEMSPKDADDLNGLALRTPPSLSTDLQEISARYSLSLTSAAQAISRRSRPASPPSPLVPSPSKAYTGIIIIADEELPVHGRNTSSLLRPCLFPKIWDSEQNLVFDRTMAERGMVSYLTRESITGYNPSGLDAKAREKAGDNPLRIMARGLFGKTPTDPVIDADDALLILSSQENRNLLRDGKIVFIVDKKVLKSEL